MAASVESVVETIAADRNAHPFGASYVAREAGVDVREAYRQLEDLAARHDLDRHFELISPFTGRSLRGFHLGDRVPIGEVFEPEEEDEEPFIVGEDNIWVTFSPTAQLQTKLARKKKQQATLSRPPDVDRAQADLRRTIRQLQQILQRSLGEASQRIGSEIRGIFTTSRMRR